MEWFWWWVTLGALAAVCGLLALVYWNPHLRFTKAGPAVIFTTHSFSAGPVRVLSVGQGWQSGMLLRNPSELIFPYVRAFDAVFCGPAAVRRVLCIGGGGFSYPQALVARGIAVDAVEIDPQVVKIARRFFGLGASLERRDADGKPLLRVFVEDGLAYLRRTGVIYNAIIIDAYDGMVAESSLTNREAFALAGRHLAPDGALAVNVATPYNDPAKLVACANDLRAVFSHVYVISCTPGDNYLSRNHVVLASDAPYDLPQATEL